jgi:hypothetical protein
MAGLLSILLSLKGETVLLIAESISVHMVFGWTHIEVSEMAGVRHTAQLAAFVTGIIASNHC